MPKSYLQFCNIRSKTDRLVFLTKGWYPSAMFTAAHPQIWAMGRGVGSKIYSCGVVITR
jgi:hypothetical protein